MGRESDLPFSVKDSRMITDPVSLDHDFDVVGIGQDFAGPVGIRGGIGKWMGDNVGSCSWSRSSNHSSLKSSGLLVFGVRDLWCSNHSSIGFPSRRDDHEREYT